MDRDRDTGPDMNKYRFEKKFLISGIRLLQYPNILNIVAVIGPISE
jgi:hypothetical protein